MLMEGVILSPPPELIAGKQNLSPNVPSATLGYQAVAGNVYAVVEDQQLDALSEGLSYIPADTDLSDLRNTIFHRRKRVRDGLQGIRERVRALSPEHEELFETYCKSVTSPFLKEVKVTGAGDGGWAEWLAKRADNQQLLNFLEWHTDAIEKLVARRPIAKEIKHQKSRYAKNVARGVDEGWLHPDGLLLLDKVSASTVRLGDLFDTLFRNISGYHQRGSNEIVAAPVAAIPGDRKCKAIVRELKGTTAHELTHIIGWLNPRWLNEAVTEHIVQVMERGKPEQLSTWSRSSLNLRYMMERNALALVLSGGNEHISPIIAMRAHTEAGDSGEEVAAFAAAVDRSWRHLTPEGESAYSNLNAYIDAQETRLKEQGLGFIAAGGETAMMLRRRLFNYIQLRDKLDSGPITKHSEQAYRYAKQQLQQVFSGKLEPVSEETITAY